MSIRFMDEQGHPAEYTPVPQPPYHLLVVGRGWSKAYDKDGNEVDPRTGKILAGAPIEASSLAEPRKRGRPRKNL